MIKNYLPLRLSLDDNYWDQVCACCGETIKGKQKVSIKRGKKRSRNAFLCSGCVNYIFSRIVVMWDFDTQIKVDVI